jgi:L-lactate utilization protein LutB
MTEKRVNYRKVAFAHYEQLGQIVCAHCGFGIRDVLEVAHLDGDRSHNEVSNLVILCPTCHKMHDLDLISTETIIKMRDRKKVVVWAKRMKDAGKKAAESRRKTSEKLKWQTAGQKAAETRKRNAAKEPLA